MSTCRTGLTGSVPHVPVLTGFPRCMHVNRRLTSLRLECRGPMDTRRLNIAIRVHGRSCAIISGVHFNGNGSGDVVRCGPCVAVHGVPAGTCSCVIGKGSTVR